MMDFEDIKFGKWMDRIVIVLLITLSAIWWNSIIELINSI
jgi:hypothetical protein